MYRSLAHTHQHHLPIVACVNVCNLHSRGPRNERVRQYVGSINYKIYKLCKSNQKRNETAAVAADARFAISTFSVFGSCVILCSSLAFNLEWFRYRCFGSFLHGK